MRIKEIAKSYGEKKIFQNLNYNFQSGKVYWLQGRNGVGKSTLLRLLLGIELPDRGEIDVPSEKLYIPEIPLVEDWLTARENIEFLYRLAKLKQPENMEWEKQLEIKEKDMETLSVDCSLGTNMKLTFSLLYTETVLKLIIIDESLSHIDCNMQKKLLKQLIKYTENNDSIVIFTHHDNLEITDLEGKINIIKLDLGGICDEK